MSVFGRLTGSRTISALEQMAAFTEARHRVIAENIANVDTPDYRRKQVDLGSFQAALAKAIERTPKASPMQPVESDQVGRAGDGSMVLRPAIEPAENLTFHDGTNGRIEQDLTEMSRNQMLHQVAVDMLAKKYRGLEAAIRGRSV